VDFSDSITSDHNVDNDHQHQQYSVLINPENSLTYHNHIRHQIIFL